MRRGANIVRSLLPLLAALTLLLAGCSHRPDPRLARAEALMDERPDSALAILDSVHPSSLRGGGDRALHAMLLTEARDKNYLDPTDDSLISVAVDYYRTHDDPLRSAISSYYQGRVYYLRDSLPAALVSYLRAKDIAERNGLHFWAGMSCRGVADTYRRVGNYGAQLTYARKQKDHTLRSGRSPYVGYALTDYAWALHNAHNTDSALAVLDQAIDTAIVRNDRGLYHQALRYRSQCLLAEDRYREAYPMLKELWESRVALSMDSLNLAWCMASLGDLDKALEMVDTIEGDGRPLREILLVRRHKATGDYRKAVEVMERLDSVTGESQEQTESSTLSYYLESHYDLSRRLDEAMRQRDRLRYLLSLLSLGVVVVLLGSVAFMTYRRRRRRLELRLALAEQLRLELRRSLGEYEARQKASSEVASQLRETISRLEAEAGDHSRVTGELREALAKAEARETQVSGLLSILRETECDFLDEVGRIAASNLGAEKVNAKLAVILRKFLTAYSKDGDKIGKLEEYADLMHSGVVGAFRAEPLHLKEADYRLFLYSVLGFSTATITLLLGEDKADKVYNRRYRIKAKVQELPEERRARYDQYL